MSVRKKIDWSFLRWAIPFTAAAVCLSIYAICYGGCDQPPAEAEPDYSDSFLAMMDQANPEPCDPCECTCESPTFDWPDGFDSSELMCDRIFSPEEETRVEIWTYQAMTNRNYTFSYYEPCTINCNFTICERGVANYRYGTVIKTTFEPHDQYCPLGSEIAFDRL